MEIKNILTYYRNIFRRYFYMKKLSGKLLAHTVVSIRKEKGMTQAQLAEATGINRAMLSRLESEDYVPSVEQMQALGDILGFEPVDMFVEENGKKNVKGIILAAGKGTRMYPMTMPVCKPLIPVYDKPLIYYPLAVLLQAGIRDVLIIVPPDEMYSFIKLFGDGSDLGINITYKIQKVQRGIADAFIIGKSFIGDDDVCLILGDNIFYGDDLAECLQKARENKGTTIFGYYVEDPHPFGVVEFDENGKAVSIEEKPAEPRSNYIVPGLYFYDNSVVEIAENVQPSERGELEITSVNNEYLRRGDLNVVTLGRDFTWLDAGSAESLLRSANTIMDIQKRTGRQVACLEEIAYKMGYIDREQLRAVGESMKKTTYGQYILGL